MIEPADPNPTESPDASPTGNAGALPDDLRGETPPADPSPDPAPDKPAIESVGHEGLGLSLGVQIGTLIGLALFSGMYSLMLHELRIAGIIFLTGVTLGVAGGIVVVLVSDTHHLHRWATADADDGPPPFKFLQAVWEGLAVGLGILTGTLPISLGCSLLYESPGFPKLLYALAGAVLIGVGVSRAHSLRSLPSSVAYALLPGLVAVLLGHFIGDLLGPNIARL